MKRQRGERHVAVDGIEVDVIDGDDVSYEEVTHGTLAREHHQSDKKCFGCLHLIKPDNPGKEPGLYHLWEQLQYIGKMTPWALATHMSRIYENEIKAPLLAINEPVLEWPLDLIYVHLTMHDTDGKGIWLNMINDLKTDEKEIKRHCYRKNTETGMIEPNEKMIRLRLDVMSKMQSLMQVNMDRLFRL